MATSNSTDFTRTGNQIITGALRVLGAIATGETPSSSEMSEGREAVNMLLKAWQAEGMGLWLDDTASITLVAGTESYSLGKSSADVDIPRPKRIVECRYYQGSSGTTYEMFRMSYHEYQRLPDKDTEGLSTNFHYKPSLPNGTLYVWPVASSTEVSNGDSIYFTYKTIIEDIDSSSDEFDLPVEWLRALKFNLAVELAPEYGMEVGPTLAALAMSSKLEVKSFDSEEAPIRLRMSGRRG